MLRKSAKTRWERWKNGEKEDIFTGPRGKISFLETGGGAKISNFEKIFHPVVPLAHESL